MTLTKQSVIDLWQDHEKWRSETLNLIASENIMSETVRSTICNDWLGRYADFIGRDITDRRYRGTTYIADLEQQIVDLAKEMFHATYVDIRPVSGHIAGAAVLMGLCKPQDIVLELGRDGGSHREAGRLSVGSLASLEVHYLPFDGPSFNVDIPKTLNLIEEKKPRLVILGSSNFLFPHPVGKIAEALRQLPETLLIFDASHILGFVAAGAFQQPLAEGADMVFGSTHKTLPGPQGGLIYTDDDHLMEAASQAICPGLVTNHHPFRMPALGLALLESQNWGAAYTAQMVKNANALGGALEESGLRVVKVDGRYTETNTVLLSVAAFGDADMVANILEKSGVIVTSTLLPDYWGREGIRIGSQEFTRRGGNEATAEDIASVISDVLRGRTSPEKAGKRAAKIAKSLNSIGYTWTE